MKKYLAAAVVGAAAGIGIYKATKRKQEKAKESGKHVPNGPYEAYFKRPLDYVAALSALLLLWPLLLLLALFIELDSPGPVFYTQERTGKGRESFKVYKFRTMKVGADRYQKIGVEVMGDDARITSFGKLLRRFKIDEIPQLLNVIKGDMAVVGPRPTLPEYLDEYEEWEKKRFAVRPGLTGMAQVNGNIYLKREEKSRYDVAYTEKISLWTDGKIVLKTAAIILLGEEKFVHRKGAE